MPPALPIEQHDIEIQRNAESWRRKPLLQKVYGSFYEQVRTYLAPPETGLRLELGSGIGTIKQFIPDCITSDIFANRWLDRVENAYALSFQEGTLGNVILLDVWHHLQFPGNALAEFRRVLRPGGRVIIIDPAAASVLGRLVYGCFHHEPLGIGKPITWHAPSNFNPNDHAYYAAQANCWRMFSRGRLPAEIRGWSLVEVKKQPAFAYVASGGFSGPQLYPETCFPLMKALDRVLAIAPQIFAMRMLVVLERTSD